MDGAGHYLHMFTYSTVAARHRRAEPLSHRSSGVVGAAPICLPVKSSFLFTCRTSHALEKDMHVLIGAYYFWPLAAI